MRPSPTTLLGTTLLFDRSGRALIAIEADGIAIVDVVAQRTSRLAVPGARAAVGFDDQIWIATGDDQLLRVDGTGRRLAEPRRLPFAGRAVLEPAPCGAPAAVWAATPPVALIDDFGQLRQTELADADLTLPLTGRRFVSVRGARLTLPSGVTAPLPPSIAVLGGAVMADGKVATLLVAQAGGRQLLTVSLGTGQVSQRSALFPGAVRVAPHRHLAVAQLDARSLVVRDLHAGRDLGRVRLDHDIEDHAVDTDGQRLAVRAPSGAIELHRLIDLLRPSGVARAIAAQVVAPCSDNAARTDEPCACGGDPRAAGEPCACGDDTGVTRDDARASDDDRTAAMGNARASRYRTAATGNAHASSQERTTTAGNAHTSKYRTTATGDAHASDEDAHAAGEDARASDEDTTDAGGDAHASSEDRTTAAGDAQASDEDTSAAGRDGHASSEGTTAAGEDARASNEDTTAAGEDAHAFGEDSTTDEAEASGEDSTAADDRACPPDEQLALLARAAKASLGAAGASSAIRTARGSAPVIAPFATAVLHTPLTSAQLVALDPRARPAAIDRGEARGQLDLERRTVALWALAAIAAAWDSRKLGYGNEGKHPYELEVGAILGMNRGFAADYVEAAREQLAAHDQQIAEHRYWRARETPIGALIEELALDALAVDILLVIAAAALWGEIARLYGILANDSARSTVDQLLVEELLAGRHDRHAIAAALDARAPLVRLGIVHVGERRARPFAELSVDPVVLDRMRGVAPELGPAIAIRRCDRELEQLDVPRSVLESAVAALARGLDAGDGRPQAARVALRGRIGSGRRTLACALAARAGRDIAVVDATALPRSAEGFLTELRAALRRAHLSGAIPCVVGLAEVAFGEHQGRALAAETLRLHPGPIVIIAAPDEDVPLTAVHVAIELPLLAETERLAVWTRALTEAGVAVASVEPLAARYKVGPGVIRRAVAAATATAASNAASDSAIDDATPTIEAYIRQTRDRRLAQYARRVERLASWSSVVLPPDVLDSLRELVARVRHGRQVYETWGMSRTMSTSRGLTALFSGQPGTGKTLVAGVIARELGLDLYQVDLSKVMSKWIGETERNLSTIFDAAEDGQVVLLFDEADSLFAKRTEVRSSNDRYANLEVNYLLQRLDAFGGIAVLTTNSGNTIDQAFKRRLSFRLSFPFPDEETRAELWRAHLPPELPVAGTLTLDALARKYQLSGGYIRNACLRAAFLAAQDETSLHQHHLERAVALEYAELGKLSSGGAID